MADKEKVIQDALGTLPIWRVSFKVKSPEDVYYRSPHWNIRKYFEDATYVKAGDENHARKKAVKVLKKNHTFGIKYRTISVIKERIKK